MERNLKPSASYRRRKFTQQLFLFSDGIPVRISGRSEFISVFAVYDRQSFEQQRLIQQDLPSCSME